MSGAKLRMLDKAYEEALKLPRSVKGAIYDFQHKFRQNPHAPGLRLKQLTGKTRLYSARVTLDYRALLLDAGNQEYVIVAIKPRQEVYDNLDRYAYQINPVSGGIEFVDLVQAESAVTSKSVDPSPSLPAQPDPLFAKYSDDTLLRLGVAQPLLGLIAKLTTEDELQSFLSYAPQLTAEVLFELFAGKTPDEVLEQITTPVAAGEQVNTDDYRAALARPTTVTTDDVALQAILEEGDFGRWKVFLHPTQRTIVERRYNGAARVSGGPGTGKTIVALHRVKYLVDRLDSGTGKDVLLTTFNRNLAADLRQRLIDLAGHDILQRVEIVNIDKLANRVVSEGGAGVTRQWIDDAKAIREWEQLLQELGTQQWDAEFLHAEWSQVILEQGIITRAEYFRARRAGRGRSLRREDRAAIWRLVEHYVKRLDEKGVWTVRQLTERAARMEAERVQSLSSAREDSGRRYRHIVVDEAQDLNASHWRMLRAMVAEGPGDIFIVGDTHQRIYGHQVTLGQLGINIRGRSARLTLSYRTTHEILGLACHILGQEEWDDLDDGHDDLTGYRSVLRGLAPELRPYPSWDAEIDGLVQQVTDWGAGASTAICVPLRSMVIDVEKQLARAGIAATVLGGEGPRQVDAVVHIGTMHRFKGLEYQRMIIAGVSEGLVPAARIAALESSDPVRYRIELRRARSLLFVAATRARDTVVISWHGTKSRFLS